MDHLMIKTKDSFLVLLDMLLDITVHHMEDTLLKEGTLTLLLQGTRLLAIRHLADIHHQVDIRRQVDIRHQVDIRRKVDIRHSCILLQADIHRMGILPVAIRQQATLDHQLHIIQAMQEDTEGPEWERY